MAILDVEHRLRQGALTLQRGLARFRANDCTLDRIRYGVRFQPLWACRLQRGIAAASASDSAGDQALFAKLHGVDLPLWRA
jgi:hypothetical protein